MHSNRQQSFFFIISLAAIYVIAWIIQAQFLMNPDVSYEIYEAKRLLAGGSYLHHFLETNPPLILYIYTIPDLAASLFSVTIMFALHSYIFFLASVSLAASYFLIQKIFSRQDAFIARVFFTVLAAVFLILPLWNFGQRDHLLVIFTAPYLLAVVYRLQGRTLSLLPAVFIGVLAAIGFALKPFFLFTFALVELYYLIYSKNLFAWIRTETLLIIVILLAYIASIFIFHPDYVFVIVPYAARIYYKTVSLSLTDIISYPVAVFTCIPLLFSIIFYRSNSYKILTSVLALASIGFFLSYVTQRTTFIYHTIPMFSFSILLLVLLFCLFATQNKISKWTYAGLSLLIGLSAGFLFHYGNSIWSVLVLSPALFFGFFGILFAVLFYLSDDKSLLKAIIYAVFIITAGFVFTNLARHTSWYVHRFALTILFLLMLFSLLVSKRQTSMGNRLFAAILGITLFAFPVYFENWNYSRGMVVKEELDKLIVFMHEHMRHQSIYLFSTNTYHTFPTVFYTDVTINTRFYFFWMLPGLLKEAKLNPEDSQFVKDNNFFIDMVADDININKPTFILVDASLHKSLINDISFAYLPYFLQNPKFKAMWKRYHYVETIESNTHSYKFQIYQRKNKRTAYARRKSATLNS